jgi:hypothetical protein
MHDRVLQGNRYLHYVEWNAHISTQPKKEKYEYQKQRTALIINPHYALENLFRAKIALNQKLCTFPFRNYSCAMIFELKCLIFCTLDAHSLVCDHDERLVVGGSFILS